MHSNFDIAGSDCVMKGCCASVRQQTQGTECEFARDRTANNEAAGCALVLKDNQASLMRAAPSPPQTIRACTTATRKCITTPSQPTQHKQGLAKTESKRTKVVPVPARGVLCVFCPQRPATACSTLCAQTEHTENEQKPTANKEFSRAQEKETDSVSLGSRHSIPCHMPTPTRSCSASARPTL